MSDDTLSNLRTKSIGFPCESEADYRAAVADPQRMRQWLEAAYAEFPTRFPAAFASGFTWHDRYQSHKLYVPLRRVRLVETGAVFLARPSCYLPYAVARTEEIEKALYVRR